MTMSKKKNTKKVLYSKKQRQILITETPWFARSDMIGN